MDAVQVYCIKPGCSCLDCETPEDSATPQHWSVSKGQSFTKHAGHQVVKEFAPDNRVDLCFMFLAELSYSIRPTSTPPFAEC